jgi:allantoinase
MSFFAIHSRQTILPDGIKDATILISNGKITDILNGSPANFPGELIDIGNKVLMPGIVDPHIHINEPGRTDWEGFDTATKAAIAGGITTLVDMPLNSLPVTTTAEAFNEKINAAQGQLNTNCGFWGGIVPGNEREIEPLIEKGVLGFKAFLTHSGIDEFPNVSENDLIKAMPIIARYNLPLLVHCELAVNDAQHPADKPKTINDKRSYQYYLASRPKSREDDAIALMIRLCEKYNCRTHVVHLSSANSIEQIARAKQKRLPVTVETAQHYLYFNAEEIRDGQTQFKCAPPIREKENNERLWQALKDGIVDFVATDHSPAPPELKELKSGDFSKAWGGISSVQLALPVLWTAAKKHNCSLNDIAKWLCETPAEFIGKRHSKGKIAIGCDADLVGWNSEESFIVTPEQLHHKHKITPYMHENLYGVVEQTWLSGVKVYDNARPDDTAGRGIFTQLNKGKIILR